jgi:hypothetical protein
LALEEIMPQGGTLSECRLVHFPNAGSTLEAILIPLANPGMHSRAIGLQKLGNATGGVTLEA